MYRVPTLDPSRPLISFPPPLPHPRTCLLVTGKNSAAFERAEDGTRVATVTGVQTYAHPIEERGIWAGHSKRIVGPTGQRFFNQRKIGRASCRERVWAAEVVASLSRFLTLAPACWSRGKIPPHPSARSARQSSPRNGGTKGNM